jgi:hypothetical protein
MPKRIKEQGVSPFLGSPLKIEFNYKVFLFRLFIISVCCVFVGYYWQSYINDYIETNHGKVFFIVVAEIFGIIYVLVTAFYELSYIYLRAFIAVLTLSYIFFSGVL